MTAFIEYLKFWSAAAIVFVVFMTIGLWLSGMDHWLASWKVKRHLKRLRRGEIMRTRNG